VPFVKPEFLAHMLIAESVFSVSSARSCGFCRLTYKGCLAEREVASDVLREWPRRTRGGTRARRQRSVPVDEAYQQMLQRREGTAHRTLRRNPPRHSCRTPLYRKAPTTLTATARGMPGSTSRAPTSDQRLALCHVLRSAAKMCSDLRNVPRGSCSNLLPTAVVSGLLRELTTNRRLPRQIATLPRRPASRDPVPSRPGL
jgi:hypothetical protein